jgi:hypothetical protein
MFYRNPSADMLLTADELNVGLLKRVKTQSFLHTTRRILTTVMISSHRCPAISALDPIDLMVGSPYRIWTPALVFLYCWFGAH